MAVIDGSSTPPTSSNPDIEHRYSVLFDAAPLPPATQKKFNRIIGDASSEALGNNFGSLGFAREALARSISQLYADRLQPETAESIFSQAYTDYGSGLLGVMQQAGERAQEKADSVGGIASGQAFKAASGSVVGQEAIERIRTLNDAFVNTFHLMNKKNPPIERLKRYAKFVTQYPDRPTHKLLEGNTALDNPIAEVAYGETMMNLYLASFDSHVAAARSSLQEPDLATLMTRATNQVVGRAVTSVESKATQQALRGVL